MKKNNDNRVSIPFKASSLGYFVKFFFSVSVKEKTGSGKGTTILKEWDKYLPLFWQLVPPSEEDTPEACADYENTSAEQVTLQSA